MRDPASVWFRFFACCIVVEGKTHSLIYDLQGSAFYDLPNEYLEIINASKNHNIATLKRMFDDASSDEIDNFFNQFVIAELGFFTTEPERFPDIDLTWESPYLITNSIIEIDGRDSFSLSNAIQQLSHLGCGAVQLRVLNSLDFEVLQKIVTTFKDTRIRHVELILPFDGEITYNNLYNMMMSEGRLNRIMIYGCSEDRIIMNETSVGKAIIQFKKDISVDDREIITPARFTTNIQSFSESQKHNLGLNRKLCIDKTGEIRNYLNHAQSFGNINTVLLSDIVADDKFREKWFVANDQIEICKVCHYRYACVSNSDIKKEGNKFFKLNYCEWNSRGQ